MNCQLLVTILQNDEVLKLLKWERFRAVNKDFDFWTDPKGIRYYGWKVPQPLIDDFATQINE